MSIFRLRAQLPNSVVPFPWVVNILNPSILDLNHVFLLSPNPPDGNSVGTDPPLRALIRCQPSFHLIHTPLTVLPTAAAPLSLLLS